MVHGGKAREGRKEKTATGSLEIMRVAHLKGAFEGMGTLISCILFEIRVAKTRVST
jgi:hypothetical protein